MVPLSDWLMLDMIERLNSVADFDRSLMNANLILFAFAAWSGPCRQSLTTITAAYDRLCQSSLLLNVSIAQIDFTEQSGDMWNRVAAWLSSQNNIDTSSYMYSGQAPLRGFATEALLIRL